MNHEVFFKFYTVCTVFKKYTQEDSIHVYRQTDLIFIKYIYIYYSIL